ncbi:putative Gpa2-guanine nucleotide-binding protein alpha-2 subunit [Halteromyces radiatus]|uniref:putative Gpa2-guanine nucleotide-binding protein alpha-2 subunit n=1 Tax=Halteromyces radiatus TaxID=101107 RepID=UPI00221E6194|nr:putative Gpa2-guanine nucleotide-binding protein alpha-2 subunit [Halteromyces radiatus]KAI8093262.1 putative Gpa2-guanine nucleotide-binding protein alpha-2 subunit [Halteromyces radiatus]
MGNCASSSNSNKNGAYNPDTATSRLIDRQIKADEKRLKTEVKLLLLGAGESGKSTVLKQMRLIHAAGFDAAERESFRHIVFSNITLTVQTILEAMESLDIKFEDKQLEEYIPLFDSPPAIKKGEPYPLDYLSPLKRLWNDAGVQNACSQGNTFALHDNVTYYFSQLDRLWSPDYVPTDQDIIRCRAKTTGIVETVFHLGPLTYRMFDVGGQRSERKKWIHCFENVTAILFVVAVSGYDQCLVEDRDSNQMHESLMLFDTICNSPWFVNTSMILFLNKIDIFKEKINVSPVSRWFPDFKGDNQNFEQTRSYFKKRFQRLNQNTEKRVYTHYTDATDTTLLKHVMLAVSDIILNENLNTLML